MKTFIESLIGQLAAVAHPAGGCFKATSGEKKKKETTAIAFVVLSPDCFNIRGGSAKMGMARRTPAP